VGLALLVRWLLEPALHGKMRHGFFYVAIILTAWNAGVWEAVAAVVLGLVAAELFFPVPGASPLNFSPEALLGNGLYLFTGLAIVWFMKSEQAALDRALASSVEARRRQDELEAERITHREARAAQELLATLVTNTRDAIISFTPEGRITAWNAAAEKLFKYSAQQALGQPVNLIISQPDAAEPPGLLERVNCRERVEYWEAEFKRGDGSSLRLTLTLMPMRDEAGKLVGASIIAREAEADAAGAPLHQVRVRL